MIKDIYLFYTLLARPVDNIFSALKHIFILIFRVFFIAASGDIYQTELSLVLCQRESSK